MTDYVAGFLFNEERTAVALIQKNKPEWQAGRFNAIGGKIEESDFWPVDAMIREFNEEAGRLIRDWEPFVILSGDWGKVMFFRAFVSTVELLKVRTMEDEHVGVYSLKELPDTLPNLDWLIPLALYNHDRYSTVQVEEYPR